MRNIVCAAIVVTSVAATVGGALAVKNMGARMEAVNAAKAKAFDAHCTFMRFDINGIRRDLLRGRSLGVGALQYRDLLTYDFENVRICMLKDDGDPVFFPTPCDFADKACVVNQLDIFLLVMR